MDKPATPLPLRLNAGDHTKIMSDKNCIARMECGGMTGISVASAEDTAAYIVTACNAYPHLTAINAELVEALDMARDLIQEAKGADGPNGGFITDHLDAAEGWIDRALDALVRAKEASHDAD